MSVSIITGDALEQLRLMPNESVHCAITSPPYYGLRNYGVAGQIGLESSPHEYVVRLVAVFSEVRRVLRSDGTFWLNLGDSYAQRAHVRGVMKSKDLLGIPWRVAFALQANGWYLRQDIIWSKPNPMPESVTDRCTKAHEYVFLLTKSARYYYDADAIKEPSKYPGDTRHLRTDKTIELARPDGGSRARTAKPTADNRNRRSVWTVTPKPFKGAHFAVFPPDLIEPCILAGSPVGGTVLDPFGGSGTTGLVAERHGRNAVLIELNPKYVELARQRVGLVIKVA